MRVHICMPCPSNSGSRKQRESESERRTISRRTETIRSLLHSVRWRKCASKQARAIPNVSREWTAGHRGSRDRLAVPPHPCRAAIPASPPAPLRAAFFARAFTTHISLPRTQALPVQAKCERGAVVRRASPVISHVSVCRDCSAREGDETGLPTYTESTCYRSLDRGASYRRDERPRQASAKWYLRVRLHASTRHQDTLGDFSRRHLQPSRGHVLRSPAEEVG